MSKVVTAVIRGVVIAGLCSACGGSPTAPASLGNSPIAASAPSVGALQVGVGSLIDVGEDAVGHWQYKAALSLSETGGVDVTVEKIDVQLLDSSGATLATASITPMVPLLRAHSSGGETVVLTAAVHVKVADASVKMTVQFRDASGNTGTVSTTYSCFGCWDY